MILKPPENITTIPYIPNINPYKDTMFEKYLLNKPAIFKRDDGESIVVYHFVSSNSTEYFPLQVMLHPQSQYRGFFKVQNSMKLFHFPKPKQPNYFEISIRDFEPLSDVDKLGKFKKDVVYKKGLLSEEEFFKYVEDKMNYHKHIKEIDTYIDFSFDV